MWRGLFCPRIKIARLEEVEVRQQTKTDWSRASCLSALAFTGGHLWKGDRILNWYPGRKDIFATRDTPLRSGLQTKPSETARGSFSYRFLLLRRCNPCVSDIKNHTCSIPVESEGVASKRDRNLVFLYTGIPNILPEWNQRLWRFPNKPQGSSPLFSVASRLLAWMKR